MMTYDRLHQLELGINIDHIATLRNARGTHYPDPIHAALLAELARVRQGALVGIRHGLRVNAGHGLHYTNAQAIAAIPEISELNIGHAVVAQAVFVGWEKAIRDMKALMTHARLGTAIGAGFSDA